ncbi:hypothetical protein [Burkholderia plantarii]|uniref:hypothetical protein n=1 Tax=Burkholderia plantarii TaxID=41899 RepID=UPI0018DC5DD3|nr:hypothetical protein [Burkholderia plantarii]MBI0328810.1 hypothetical protein [Burkholderia plantarii]
MALTAVVGPAVLIAFGSIRLLSEPAAVCPALPVGMGKRASKAASAALDAVPPGDGRCAGKGGSGGAGGPPGRAAAPDHDAAARRVRVATRSALRRSRPARFAATTAARCWSRRRQSGTKPPPTR